MYLSEEIKTQLNELSGIDKRISIESQIITRNQFLIAITIDKSIINFQSFEPLDIIRFILLLKPDYPVTPPLLYCLSRFCVPELCDGRDFLEDTLQMKWDPENCFLKLIISQIPSFIERYISYYINNKNEIINRKMFGRYYLDSIYELSIIKYIPYIYFDVISEVVSINKKKNTIEDRKILITDNFVLLFCNKSLYDLDQLRLVFVGPITSLVHIQQLAKNGMVLLKWMVRGKGLGNYNYFIMQLKTSDGDYIVDTLIENLNKRSIQFKITNKINSKVKREGSVPPVEINLVEEKIKQLEKKITSKEEITKENISILISLYEKAIQYYSALNDDRFELCIKKIQYIYSNNEYTSLLNMKTISKDNNQYNVTQFKRKRKKRTSNEEGEGKKRKEKKTKKKSDKKIEKKEIKPKDDKDNNNDIKKEDNKEKIKEDKKEDNINNIKNDNEQKVNNENKKEKKKEEKESTLKDDKDEKENTKKNESNIINENNNVINDKEEKKVEEKIEKKEEDKKVEKKEEDKIVEEKEENKKVNNSEENKKVENKEDNKKQNKKENKKSKKETKDNRPKRNLRKREDGNRIQRKIRNDINEDDFMDNEANQRMIIDKKEIEEMIKNELSMNLTEDKDKENKTETKVEDNIDKEINLKNENSNNVNNELEKDKENK